MEERTAPTLSEQLQDSLGVSESMLGTVDPIGLVAALWRAFARAGTHPLGLAQLGMQYPPALMQATLRAVTRAVSPVPPSREVDRRFSDPAWTENVMFALLKEWYLCNCEALVRLIGEGDDAAPGPTKAGFAAHLLGDALAPTNFLPTNPRALQRAFRSGGLSVLRGMRNFATDVAFNEGWPRKVDTSTFELGRNMAATPGKVVYRNDLIELIQYQPQSEQVRAIPVLVCPPWINKYYIMDLAPGRSLIEWAVAHGLTTFSISYRNPDSSMAATGFDDYLLKGPRKALDVVRAVTGSPTVNLLSVCLGGTLSVALLAYLDATGHRDLVNSSTLLNCLVDHHDAGTFSGVFVDDQTLARVERLTEESGYLDSSAMAHTFDLLRANDLVFSFVESGWLLGEPPPAFDLLAWNQDSTHMPAKMQAFYLRRCWQDNALALDELELAGQRLMVSKLDVDAYVVAAVDDHIVPWRSSYRTTQLLKGDCRFVLSSQGHIAGIVNPPGPKSRLWRNDSLPADPDEWRSDATEVHESWWTDWIRWITDRSGDLGAPPPMGTDRYPVIVDAPGTYVLT